MVISDISVVSLESHISGTRRAAVINEGSGEAEFCFAISMDFPHEKYKVAISNGGLSDERYKKTEHFR